MEYRLLYFVPTIVIILIVFTDLRIQLLLIDIIKILLNLILVYFISFST